LGEWTGSTRVLQSQASAGDPFEKTCGKRRKRRRRRRLPDGRRGRALRMGLLHRQFQGTAAHSESHAEAPGARVTARGRREMLGCSRERGAEEVLPSCLLPRTRVGGGAPKKWPCSRLGCAVRSTVDVLGGKTASARDRLPLGHCPCNYRHAQDKRATLLVCSPYAPRMLAVAAALRRYHANGRRVLSYRSLDA
jgi:hypothetical protein